jgi:hypothetical protein
MLKSGSIRQNRSELCKRRKHTMTSSNRAGLIFGILAGSALLANAQAVNTAALTVKDVDQEARDAYQNFCGMSSSLPQRAEVCTFPALPPNKRLALRWFSVFCHEAGSRVTGIELRYALIESGSQVIQSSRFRALQPFNESARILEAPVYAHADRAPSVQMNLSDTAGSTGCTFFVRGYLVNKE